MPSPRRIVRACITLLKGYRSRSQHQLLASLPLAASPAPGCLAGLGPQAPCACDQTGTMSTFGYRRGLSKYESIDEDELLASLTAEELKELERELEDIEPDRNLPVGLRQKSLTEKTPTGNFSREALMAYWEKESQKLLEKERLGECGKVGFPDLFLAAPRAPSTSTPTPTPNLGTCFLSLCSPCLFSVLITCY